MKVENSLCSHCHAEGALEARAEAVPGFEGVVELVIVCSACETRTHASYTNQGLEESAARIRSIGISTERGRRERKRALAKHRRAFNLFNAQTLKALELCGVVELSPTPLNSTTPALPVGG